MGPRAGLDDVENRKFLTVPGLEFRPLGRRARSQSLYRLHYPGVFPVTTVVIENPFKLRSVLLSWAERQRCMMRSPLSYCENSVFHAMSHVRSILSYIGILGLIRNSKAWSSITGTQFARRRANLCVARSSVVS
jgi:hypothetical protein